MDDIQVNILLIYINYHIFFAAACPYIQEYKKTWKHTLQTKNNGKYLISVYFFYSYSQLSKHFSCELQKQPFGLPNHSYIHLYLILLFCQRHIIKYKSFYANPCLKSCESFLQDLELILVHQHGFKFSIIWLPTAFLMSTLSSIFLFQPFFYSLIPF